MERLRWLLVGVLSAGAMAAVLGVPYVGTHDGPNHFVNCVLAERLSADPSARLHDYLEVGSALSGQGFHVACRGLVGWMDPFLAYALTLAGMLVLLGVAATVLAKALDATGPAWAFGFAVTACWVFYMGFLSFHISVALGLIAVALAVRMELAVPRPYLGLAILLLIGAYAHIFQAALTGAAVLVVLLARAPAGMRMRIVVRAALAGFPAAFLFFCVLALFVGKARFAGVAEGQAANPEHLRAPLQDLVETFAGGVGPRAWGLAGLAVVSLAVGLARLRHASPAQRALLAVAVVGLGASLVVPFHLGRWSYFAPRLSLFPLLLAPAAASWPAGWSRRAAEALFVAAAAASLFYVGAYHQRLYAALSPDLAALELPVTRTGPRLPIILTAAQPDFAHVEPAVMLGHLYMVKQGGLDPFVWADAPSLDAIAFKAPPEELFGDMPGRYPRSELAAAGTREIPPRPQLLDIFTLWGRTYEDVILATEDADVREAFPRRGYRLEGEAGRVQLLRFEGCPLRLRVRGPAALPHGLLLQVGLPALSRPMEQRALPPGTALPPEGLPVEVPGLLCGPSWLVVRSGLGAPPGEILRCAESPGGARSRVELRPEGPELPCTLVPAEGSAAPGHHHE
jgi:hypothetical protein